MEIIKVNSTNIDSVGYDAARQLLVIQFRTGAAYEYSDVPEDVYNNFITAPSPGKYFINNIKRQFLYKKTEIS